MHKEFFLRDCAEFLFALQFSHFANLQFAIVLLGKPKKRYQDALIKVNLAHHSWKIGS
jgi:hypothetical protein